MAINHPYEIPGVVAVWHAANAADIDTATFDIPDGVSAWRRMRNPDNPGDTDTTYDNTIWHAAPNDYRPEFAAGKNLVNGIPAVLWRTGGGLRSNSSLVPAPITLIVAFIDRSTGNSSRGLLTGGVSNQRVGIDVSNPLDRYEIYASGSATSYSHPNAGSYKNLFTVAGTHIAATGGWVKFNDETIVPFEYGGAPAGIASPRFGTIATISNASSWRGEICTAVLANTGLTEAQYDDIYAWIRAEWGFAASTPHPGIHEVTELTHADDPNNIYFEQGVQIGDQFSYKETTETNGWGVSIDAFGYPIIDPAGGSGTDSFLFNIDRGAGWEPEPPASYTWTFAVGVPEPPPVGEGILRPVLSSILSPVVRSVL